MPAPADSNNEKNTPPETAPARIQPYSANPRYWQYREKPVLLLGGSKTDHIFLLDDLQSHLDEVAAAGANFLRCTMSQRESPALKPHKLLPNGTFDLEQWNQEYWTRFANCLEWCRQRDIILQIEVWDRFDYSRNFWESSPWNPKNNINYTFEQTGFAPHYPEHASRDLQPFFHTIPGMPRYEPRLDRVRRFQEAFVAKMLSYTLEYGNVLYCMNNETSTPPEWGRYWIEFIQNAAAAKSVDVYTTDMFDDGWLGEKSEHTPVVFSDPRHYRFADLSQVNSRNYDETHWQRVRWLIQRVQAEFPRPCNHTKIYGSGYKTFGTGGPEDGVERFWRNLIAGSAAVRFHRPDSGNGLNDRARACIGAARILERLVPLWECTPRLDLLAHRQDNAAYLTACPGKYYALYFPNGGSVQLDLRAAPGPLAITWISVAMGTEVRSSQTGGYRLLNESIPGGRIIPIEAPYNKGGWVAAIRRR